MMRSVVILVVAGALLAGCGGIRDSRLNPVNWFGRSAPAPATQSAEPAVNPLIPRARESVFRQERDETYAGTPVAQIETMEVLRRPGGAILQVTGRTEGTFATDVRLVPESGAQDGGTRTYALRAIQEPARSATDGQVVTAGLFLTDQDLAGVSELRVTGLRDARTSRR